MKFGDGQRIGNSTKSLWDRLKRLSKPCCIKSHHHHKPTFKWEDDHDIKNEGLNGLANAYLIQSCRLRLHGSKFRIGNILVFPYDPIVAVSILTVLWVALYSASLVGGDLRSVIAQLGRIGACLIAAIACFIAAILISLLDKYLTGRVRLILLGVIITLLNILFIADHGGSLSHHGAYNMLIFAVIVLPSLLIAAIEYGVWRMIGTQRLVIVHITIFVAVGVATTNALNKATAIWDIGFRGECMLPLTNQTCTPINRGLPWVDIFPEGTQNFGAGTFTCGDGGAAAKALNFSVNLSFSGVLTISCNAGRGTYTPLPSTRTWPKADKLVEEDYEGLLSRPFNKNVMKQVRKAGEIPYQEHEPVLLPEGIEAVIVRCGNTEKLVTRVRPDPKALERTLPHVIAPSNISVTPDDSKLDVVILFVDAVSRRGFHRRLASTVAALEEADAQGLTRLYQFFRYSVVEFCTEPNARAMFLEMIEENTQGASILWEDYAQSGYVTLSTADTCQDLGAAYLNRSESPGQPNFDHELLSPFCHSDYFAEDANPFGNFKGPYSICARCLKGQQVHEHELEYLHSFRAAYPDRAKFSLAWFLEGHEGTTEVLRFLDDGLSRYLKNFSARDWNRTALVIAADHGLHMGFNFALSQNGAVEHKNPFLAIMLPPWFAAQHSRHDFMTVNQQRLVTGLDIYKTLQAIRVAGLKKGEIDLREKKAELSRLQTGIDLLHNEVHEERTCADASIPNEWCQCL